MPIRMVEDPDDGDFHSNNNKPGRGGGGLGSLLPLLLTLIFKRPKLMIPLIVIGGILYFWQGGCGSLLPVSENQSGGFATGGVLKPEEYEKAEIFNFLYEDNRSNPLPESVSLKKYCPDRMNQGAQGSCVAWSNAYAIRTILYSRQTGKDPNSVAFSPSYLYNNIRLDDNCQGSYIVRAVDWMEKYGAVPFSDFGYNERTCSQQIPASLNDKANNFKIKGAQRLGENPEEGLKLKDILQIKHALNAGSPVAIGMMVGGSFMQDMMGKKVWHPNTDDYQQYGFGGHAMTVIGYDDNLEGGAVEIMNSWGPEWGEDGIAWVRYSDFVKFTREAYAYAPMGEVNQPVPDKFDVEFSLYNTKTNQDIPLSHEGNGRFVTTARLTPGTPFRIKIKNNIECYTYVFGQEIDLSSYVLYPYSAKHSPYCGVTGTRVFPRGYTMQPDDKGDRDRMAILISRQPVDYQSINENAFMDHSGRVKQADYHHAFTDYLKDSLVSNVQFKTGNKVSFQAPSTDRKMVLISIEVTK